MFHLRFVDRLKFFMERQFVKGALFQLLVVIAIIGLISLIGGLLVHPANEPSVTLGEAVWWAFLRLTDPGYLGDDEGTWRRIISTILTVSGYVIFLGALVAIMTQRLIALMRELERGLTPVAIKNHVVILGWSNRTVPLVRELMGVEQEAQGLFLHRDINRIKLVVLAEEVSALHARQLRDAPGIGRRMRNIILRSGTALQPEALHRAACLNSAVVVIPSVAHGPHELVTSDVETIKALLSLNAQAREENVEPPYVVAELQDVRKLALLKRAYSGRLEVVAGDLTISSLMAQNVLHPGLSEVYSELLTSHEGNEFYLRDVGTFTGKTLGFFAQHCPKSIVCGLLRRDQAHWQPLLNAPPDTVLAEGDLVVVMARRFEDADPAQHRGRLLDDLPRKSKRTLPITDSIEGKHLLILGWNHRVPALIHELASYGGDRFTVDQVSVVPAQERTAAIANYSQQNQRVPCTPIEADYMREGTLREITPANYDTIILVSSDRLPTGEEADARAIVGYTILDDMLQSAKHYPQILLELNDPDNEPLVRYNRSETIISPLILSHLLGQVALRPELRTVFDELFTVGGAEILFRQPSEFNLNQPLAFWKLEARVAEHGETALGVYRAKPDDKGRRLHLNPPRNEALTLEDGDQIVVLTTSY
jgi:hypothetical protein